MRLLFTILFLCFFSELAAQSSNQITIYSNMIWNTNGRKGKNIERLFDGNTSTKLDATGVAENDWVIPYRSFIALPSIYGNMKFEVFEGSGSTGTITLRLYNDSKSLLGSYTITKSAFNSWVTVNPAQGMHAHNNVRYVEVYFANTTDLNIGVFEMRLYGDVTGSASSVYPGTTITPKTDPGKHGHGINIIDDRLAQYLNGGPTDDPLFPKLAAKLRIGYEGPRFDTYPNAYTNPLTNINFNLNRFGGNDHLNTRVFNVTRPLGIKVQVYHTGANIKQLTLDGTTGPATNGQYLPNTTDIQKWKYLEPGADSSDTDSWAGLAELHYNIAALYGTNTSADMTGKTVTNGSATTGQGGIDAQEIGNEWSKDWNGTRANFSPYVYYQMIKKVYPRIKEADPNMPVFMAALTFMDTTYLKALYFWHYWENGSSVAFPCDGINLNVYLNNDMDGQGLSTGSTALNPESWNLRARLVHLKELLDKIFPNVELNISENGVAVDDGSPWDVNAIGGKTDRQVAADLTMRNKAIFQSLPFITTYYYYAFFEDGSANFNSMSATYYTFSGGGSYTGNGLFAQGYALANELAIEDEYEWWSTVQVDGGTTSAWVTVKNHPTDPLKKLFKFWMPTMNGSTSSISIDVGENALSATRYSLNYSGLTATSNSASIVGNNVSVTAGEGMQWLEVTYSEDEENQLPTAAAGTDQTITLPTSQVTVSGSSSSDPDGTIDTYLWEKVSGPTGGTITNANSASTTITGLTAGTYVFRLTVTDDDGGEDTDEISIVVNAASNRRSYFRGSLRNRFRNQ